jgi:hypothetical protein
LFNAAGTAPPASVTQQRTGASFVAFICAIARFIQRLANFAGTK